MSRKAKHIDLERRLKEAEKEAEEWKKHKVKKILLKCPQCMGDLRKIGEHEFYCERCSLSWERHIWAKGKKRK